MTKPKKNRKKRVTAVERADIAAVEALAPGLRQPVARAATAAGELGDQPPLRFLSLVLLGAGLWRRNRRLAEAGARMIVAHHLATIVKARGKDLVDRTRPEALMNGHRYRMEPGHSGDHRLRAFPSGHMAGALAVARAAAREYPENRVGFYGLAALIGALQIPRRAHFPTDVLAGALVGLGAERATHAAIGWVRTLSARNDTRPLPTPV
jgi:membrane-associated phospholipid phosphatase